MAVDEAKVAEIQAKLEERENHIRESWVRAMEARIVKDELAKCHKTEGVNHYENCSWLSQKYLNMLKENRVKGYKTIDV
ncbi:NADH-ubiquinone oxidoreductase 12 kDa subunit [Crepidotus variabilis]|uniref:NADH-ubiquinone oxidoreductase 12 kDa subunit n=1 Tax=Crepidotus variabilis TaxID=179855 RepID=A0A9P6ENR3_9AGAR|nr:NADH-ubiquinone oxidoreductase 12 kDa subunit [Crepidotus variabilis]